MTSTIALSGVTITLKTSDDKELVVPKEYAMMSTTLANLLSDLGDAQGSPIPLHNVTHSIMTKIVSYCEYHYQFPTPPSDDEKKDERRTDDIIPWDKEFCAVDQSTLFEMILAANFLEIKPLLDLTCKTVANMIKGKTPEEIRRTFNIKNDFTPEEEEQVRKENEWCDERQ